MILPQKNERPIPQTIRDKVKHRSQNRCEYVDAKGRCNKTTGLSIHHLKHRVDGGCNEVGNLLHICGFHRRLLHGLVHKKKVKVENKYQINGDIEVIEYVKEYVSE